MFVKNHGAVKIRSAAPCMSIFFCHPTFLRVYSNMTCGNKSEAIGIKIEYIGVVRLSFLLKQRREVFFGFIKTYQFFLGPAPFFIV